MKPSIIFTNWLKNVAIPVGIIRSESCRMIFVMQTFSVPYRINLPLRPIRLEDVKLIIVKANKPIVYDARDGKFTRS